MKKDRMRNRLRRAGRCRACSAGAGVAPHARPTRQAAVRRHARSRHRLRDAVGRCRGTRPTGTGSTTTTPASSTSSCSPPTCRRATSNGGKHPFYADAWLPSDAIRGELAESWEWKENPLRVEIKLRKGIMFPEKPGVMASRELVADDVVFSYNRLANSPKKIADLLRPRREGRGAPTSTPSSSTSRTTTPSGTTASAGATTRASCRRKWPTPAPPTGRTPTAPAPSCSTDFVQGNSNTYDEEPDLLGQGEDQRRRSTSCRSSTSSSTAPSRTRRPSSPRCAPASSTSSRPSAGRTSTS